MTGKTAVVIGASGGIGCAFANAVEAEDEYDQVVRFYRTSERPYHLDIQPEHTIGAAASFLNASGISPSLIFVATGLLHSDTRGPEKSLRELDQDWLTENYQVNAIGPALVAKYFLPLMPKC